MTLTNTVVQYRGDRMVALFQWGDTRAVYRLVNSVARYGERRRGFVGGFFDAPQTGDRIEWLRSSEADPFCGRIVTRFEVTDGKPRIY